MLEALSVPCLRAANPAIPTAWDSVMMEYAWRHPPALIATVHISPEAVMPVMARLLRLALMPLISAVP
jgi:hypothetical protein